MTNVSTHKVPSLFDADELDAILADDDFLTGNTVVAEKKLIIDASAVSEDVVSEVLADIEIESQLSESLKGLPHEESESQILEPDPETVFEMPISVEGATEVVRPEKPARAKTPRGSGISTLLPSEAAVKLWGPHVATDGLPLDSTHPVEYTALDSLAKKIKEKAVNALECYKSGSKPSVYTQRALCLLKEHGSFTANQLRDDYLSRPYSVGTSSAQTSQMMILLPALRIATREGNKLTLNPNSTLFPVLYGAVAGEPITDPAE